MSLHNDEIRAKIAALEKQKIGMSYGNIDYPRINADIQALAAQLELEHPPRPWYDKPIGRIGVGVAIAAISSAVTYLFTGRQ